MAKIIVKLEKAEILWRGTVPMKDGKVKDMFQALTRDPEGKASLFDIGGNPGLVKSVERGEVLNLDVSIRAFGDNIYTDVESMQRPGLGVKKAA